MILVRGSATMSFICLSIMVGTLFGPVDILGFNVLISSETSLGSVG